MAKPFSIQSPEDIAKEYGGNKQKIGQAMQLGIVDPTAGVLAGMFIDRMRSPQTMEGANPPTVAQQVMGGAPAASPPSPASPGGLEALPQGAPSMAPPPEMGAMPAPEGPPMGMAEGGIVGLDIPDTMFDESSNGGFDEGYAGGGLVAFAGGGALGPWFEEQAVKAFPGIGITSRQRSAAKNASVDGVPNSYHLTDNARDFTPPKGMGMGQLASGLKALYGAGFDIINEGNHVHVEPGPKNERMVRSAPKDVNMNTAGGRAVSFDESMTLGRQMLAGLPREGLDRARGVALEELDPEEQEKNRKSDMWAGLAEMGFRMASSNSPYLLQAIGEAATATLPGIRASKKERKEAKNEAVRTLMSIEDVDRKTATAGVELGMEIYKSNMSQDQFKQRMTLEQQQLAQQASEGALNRAAQRDIAAMRPESLGFRERFAKDIFADYVRRNATGNLIVNGKRLPPNSKSNEELRVMAMQEVVNRMPSGQQSGGFDPITGLPVVTPTGGGKQQVVTTDYGQM